MKKRKTLLSLMLAICIIGNLTINTFAATPITEDHIGMTTESVDSITYAKG